MPARLIAGRYELQALIGRGGAGSVYRAWDRKLERSVAVKVLLVDPDQTELLRRRSEAHLLASLNHPSLVTLYDAIATSEATYLVMELLLGGTLQARIRRGPMSSDGVAAVAADLADALAHIHERGIVHRDVKPGNVLLAEADPDGWPPNAKLSDFGIAKLLETSPGTTTGVLGTAHYLSPEQARGEAVGPASDVYSLGLALIECATGHAVFPGTAVESLTARLLRDPEVPGGLGYGWRSLLTAMTAREPGDRPAAQEVASRVRHLAISPEDHDPSTSSVTAPLAVTAPTATLAATPRRRARRSRRVAVVGGALALAVGAAVALSALLPGLPGAGGAPPAAAERSVPARPTPAADSNPPAMSASAVPAVARSSAAPSGTGATAGSRAGTSTSGSAAGTAKKPKKAGKSTPPGNSGSNGRGAAHGRRNGG